MITYSSLPLWSLLIPVAGALLASRFRENQHFLRGVLSFFVVLFSFCLVAIMLPAIMSGKIVVCHVLPILPNLEFILLVDPLGIIFGLVASGLWLFAIIYATGYMHGHNGQPRFFFYYLLSMSATLGVAFAGNIFTLYLFFEYLTLCTYPLVIHLGTKEAHKSGLKYIIYCLSGGALVLVSLIILQGVAPGALFAPGGFLGSFTDDYRILLLLVLLFLLAGFGTKAAVIPLHSWLPGAMVAPTPVSALLHAVAVVKSGVFGIVRTLYFIYSPQLLQELGVENLLAVIVSLTIILGSILALRQGVLKLRLAYSTISQLGYITLGALLLTRTGFLGGVVHIINHALLKITLFFCAGIIIEVTGKTRIEELKGIGRQMPLTMMCFALGGLGLIGILPINGYISKFYLLQGSLDAGKIVFAFVILTSSLLNAMYYLPIVVNAFLYKGSFNHSQGPEAPLTMLLPTVALASLCVVAGLFAHKLTIPLVEKVVSYVF